MMGEEYNQILTTNLAEVISSFLFSIQLNEPIMTAAVNTNDGLRLPMQRAGLNPAEGCCNPDPALQLSASR